MHTFNKEHISKSTLAPLPVSMQAAELELLVMDDAELRESVARAARGNGAVGSSSSGLRAGGAASGGLGGKMPGLLGWAAGPLHTHPMPPSCAHAMHFMHQGTGCGRHRCH